MQVDMILKVRLPTGPFQDHTPLGYATGDCGELQSKTPSQPKFRTPPLAYHNCKSLSKTPMKNHSHYAYIISKGQEKNARPGVPRAVTRGPPYREQCLGNGHIAVCEPPTVWNEW